MAVRDKYVDKLMAYARRVVADGYLPVSKNANDDRAVMRDYNMGNGGASWQQDM